MIETMMTYKSSPRPNFNKPTHIKYKKMQTYIWGDKEAGFVKDWIYLSNKNLHQIIFGMEAKAVKLHECELFFNNLAIISSVASISW